jgi:hypothetical protein
LISIVIFRASSEASPAVVFTPSIHVAFCKIDGNPGGVT